MSWNKEVSIWADKKKKMKVIKIGLKKNNVKLLLHIFISCSFCI